MKPAKIDIAEEARKFQQGKRVENRKVLPADAAMNALTMIREELRDYLTGNKALNPQHMLSMCNRVLA